MDGTRDDRSGDGSAPRPPERRKAEEREVRLAAALRANLRRRKEQARARSVDGGQPAPAPQEPGGEDKG